MPDYTVKLAEIKAAWGITSDLFDKKLDRLLTAAEGNPTVEAITALLRSSIQPSNIEFMLLGVAQELRDFVAAGWKSVPKKNRSALA